MHLVKTYLPLLQMPTTFEHTKILPTTFDKNPSSNVALIGGNSTKPGSSYYALIKAVLSLFQNVFCQKW